MFGCHHMFGHPLYIWMPPMFGHLPVCLDSPICLDTPLYIRAPLCLDALCICVHTPICLDTPYVWMPPYGCLDTPHVWMPPYVWKIFGCLLYIYNTKKACFVRLRGCPYVPYIWMPPYVWILLCIFGHPYVWMPSEYVCTLPYVWTPPMFGCPHMFGRCLDACCTYTTQRKHALSD